MSSCVSCSDLLQNSPLDLRRAHHHLHRPELSVVILLMDIWRASVDLANIQYQNDYANKLAMFCPSTVFVGHVVTNTMATWHAKGNPTCCYQTWSDESTQSLLQGHKRSPNQSAWAALNFCIWLSTKKDVWQRTRNGLRGFASFNCLPIWRLEKRQPGWSSSYW